jgi:hypothetical protein
MARELLLDHTGGFIEQLDPGRPPDAWWPPIRCAGQSMLKMFSYFLGWICYPSHKLSDFHLHCPRWVCLRSRCGNHSLFGVVSTLYFPDREYSTTDNTSSPTTGIIYSTIYWYYLYIVVLLGCVRMDRNVQYASYLHSLATIVLLILSSIHIAHNFDLNLLGEQHILLSR